MRKLNPIRKNNETNKNDVFSIEKTLGVTLSDEYREFLYEYNGGLFEEQLVEFDDDETNIIFLGINGEKDLLNINSLYLGRLPNNTVAIGMDPGGDLLCLSLDEITYNYVYYWRAEEEKTDPCLDDLVKLSSSFFEFLDSLQEDDE